MNRHIKRYLVVYIALVLALVGITGVTYAITSTDADQYVTRSEYAVDMAHLQSKLESAEAGLLDNINRYRSTNVKFVMWDTPNKYATTSYNNGVHNGGNYFPRPGGNGNWMYPFGFRGSNGRQDKKNGAYTNYEMYRVWNGDYFVTKAMAHSDDSTNPFESYPLSSYAVPLDSHPGWYLVVKIRAIVNSGAVPLFFVAKLDPNSTTPRPATNQKVTARFRKEFFIKSGVSAPTITTNKVTNTYNCPYYDGEKYFNGPFADSFFSGTSYESQTGNISITSESWVDAETGDYMLSLTPSGNYSIACGLNGSTYYNYLFHWNSLNNATFVCIIPKDNVEYMCGNTRGMVAAYGGRVHGGKWGVIDAARIGTKVGTDAFWEYEFVDCDNGIKYWHAYRPATKTIPSGGQGAPFGYTIHYSLPIVY